MKKIISLLSCVCVSATVATAQTYVPDTEFGDGGSAVTNLVFSPKDVKLINDNYYFISSDYSDGKILKTDYNGAIDTNFGSSGVLSFNGDGIPHYISGFKFSDGYFYIYGKTNANADTGQDMFIAKIDESGSFDAGFGTNGIATIDFGEKESLNDFVFDGSGKLYCTGISDNKMIFFKLDADGDTDISFDASGYKYLTVNSSDTGYYIKPYNGNYLLVGTDYIYTNSTIYQKLLLAMIDESGNFITSYGTNGYKLISLEDGMSNSLTGIELNGDNLYVDYYYAYSSTSGSELLSYNIASDATNYTIYALHNSYIKLYNGKIYYTGSNYCSPNQMPCGRNFILKRLLPDGNADTGFQNTGTITYDFDDGNISDAPSDTFIMDSTGKILIAGTANTRLAMVRLKEGELATQTIRTGTETLYPNPFTDHISLDTERDPVSIEITDLNGKKVCNPPYSFNGHNAIIDLSTIKSTGIYILKAVYKNSVVTAKIIRE